MTDSHEKRTDMISEGHRIVECAWGELRKRVSLQRRLGIVPARLPDASLEEAERRSTVGRDILQRIDSLDEAQLPHELALTLRLIRLRAHGWSREADWYWLVCDPVGSGFYGMYLPTGYCGGLLLNAVHGHLASFPFADRGDLDRYLALIADYARLIHQFADRTSGQALRGIRMPAAQVGQARTLLRGFRDSSAGAIRVAAERLAHLHSDAFAQEIERRISEEIRPAFDRALTGLSDEYLALAPERVGISLHPGGEELYAELVRLHTTLPLAPEQILREGSMRLEVLQEEMAQIRSELGFKGDHAAFVAALDADPRWCAKSSDEVAAVFQRYLDRFLPHFDRYFSVRPEAACTVAPLPVALQGAMTYGYYEAPLRTRKEGRYLFNAANLTTRSLINVGALAYHELMPGHHLHLATQQENETLHDLRRNSFVNAYNEGWAEYSATFAGEIGLYELPEERYGRLMNDAFLACRLVVDTGMNTLGWTLERAREYMRARSAISEGEIASESLRYSADIPAQSLAYKLGDTHILDLRARMKRALGTQFNLRMFHDAVLAPGALPLPDLEWHIEHEISRMTRMQ